MAPASLRPALGTVMGRAQTLSSRDALRFTLYDIETDEPILCYADQEIHGWLHDLLDKIVEVDGMVARDVATGKPRVVRAITRIEEVEPTTAEDLSKLIGMLPGHLPAEPKSLSER